MSVPLNMPVPPVPCRVTVFVESEILNVPELVMVSPLFTFNVQAADAPLNWNVVSASIVAESIVAVPVIVSTVDAVDVWISPSELELGVNVWAPPALNLIKPVELTIALLDPDGLSVPLIVRVLPLVFILESASLMVIASNVQLPPNVTSSSAPSNVMSC